MQLLLLLSIFAGACQFARSADILAVIPSPFYSHQATFRPLWQELAKKGHKITLITTDLMDANENITQIDYHGAYEVFEKNSFNNLLKRGLTIFESLLMFKDLMKSNLEYQFTHPGLVEMLENNRTFDLMIVELAQPGWPLLSYKFKCPYIGLSSMDTYSGIHSALGNPVHPALYQQADAGFPEKMSLKDRILSTSLTVIGELVFGLIFTPFSDNYLKGLFGDDLPTTEETWKNMSLLIVNANPTFFPIRPLTPTTINLGGGLHLTHPKALPQDLQKYLDDAKDGCIYVSFGTTVSSKYLTDEQKEVLVKVFQDMAPMKVLWKFDEVNIPNKSKNVEIRTWVPQQDVLRHPNVKAFITQGGLQSMEEAIDSAVPMLGMPFYGDQVNNVNKMVLKKFGLKVVPKEMTRETLRSTLKELLENPLYKKNIVKLSAVSKDQPMRGLEKAVWWTEYVLRHGTEHLRSPSADIPLYQYFFLDVIAFLSVTLYVLYILIKLAIRNALNLIRYLYNIIKRKQKKE